MPQEIYNEGRVVGLSAWEIYMKNALSNGVLPENIPTEPEWLTSMIGSGASMILRVPVSTSGIVDFDLPTGSALAAAGIVIANPFMGTCDWDDNLTWATKVTSYGGLIQNDSEASPSGASVPYDASYTDAQYVDCVSEFLKITDGIVYVKGATWIPTDDTPEKDIDPKFNQSTSTIRLYIGSPLTKEVRILLTGFTNKYILQGLSGHAVAEDGVSIGGSTDISNNNWPNGGMLGPEIAPWASKIIFIVPNSAYNLSNALTRTIPSDAEYTEGTIADAYTFRNTDGTIRANSVVDFNSITLTDYYDANTFSASPILNESVGAVSMGGGDSCNTITAWYPGMSAAKITETQGLSTDAEKKARFFPPALYVAQITSTGAQRLVPIDTAAPGTVKGFEDPTKAYTYKQMLPNNYALYHNSVTNTYSFVTNTNDPNVWSGTAKLEYLAEPKVEITAGSEKAKFVALTHYNNGTYTDYVLTGASGTVPVGPSNNMSWENLLTSLKENKAVDVLGTKLHNLGTELTASNTIGITNKVDTIGADNVTLKAGSNPNVAVNITATAATSDSKHLATFDNDTSIKVGTNFIEFGNGLRLYISGTNPGTSGVPDGSIGIGWE